MNIVEKNLSEAKEKEFRNGVSNDDAKQALRLLLKWIGENPEREGLKETPKRVLKAFEWNSVPNKILQQSSQQLSRLKINKQKAGIKTYSLVVDLLINNYQSKI